MDKKFFWTQTKAKFMNYNDKLIDRYLELMDITIKRLQSNGGRDKWPLPKMHIWNCEIYISPLLLRSAYELFKRSEAKGLSSEDITAAYKYPTYFARLPFLYLFRAISDLSEQEMSWLGYKVMDIIDIYHKGNYESGLERKNNVLDENSVQDILEQIKFTTVSDSAGGNSLRILSQLRGKLYLYLELIFNDTPNLGYEIHGPYEINGKLLLVREYHNLKFEFWQFTNDMPFEKIFIYEIYDASKIKIGVDIHGRLYTDVNPADAIEDFAVYIDDVIHNNIERKEKVSGIMDTYLQKGATVKSKLDKVSIIKSFAYTRSFLLKPLTDLLCADWRPSNKVLDKINKSGLSNEEKKFEKFLLSTQLNISQRFDPRTKLAWS